MPYLLNEDAAVKAKLKGLTVADANAPVGGRPVTVRFRLPEDEMADQTFPFVAITRTNIAPATEREHRGKVALMYTPESVADWNPDVETYDTSPYVVDFPIPVDIHYQITVRARKEQHIISLAAQLAQQDRLPYRFGFLEVPQDGTVRSLFVDGGPDFTPARDGDSKRLFQANYLIRIPTELLAATIEQATKVSSVVFEEIDLLVPTADIN